MFDRGELYIKICGRLEKKKSWRVEREILIGLDSRRKKRQPPPPLPMGSGLNSQESKSFEIDAVTINKSMTEYHHLINGQPYLFILTQQSMGEKFVW